MNPYTVEICCCSYQSVLAARRGGASRVELCKVLGVGGVTPSYGLIQMAVKVGIPVNVLIRPREGDFLYSSYEAEEILRDIGLCGAAGVNGVVVGALNPDSTVDADMCRDFVKAAKKHHLSTTFHRAIDRCADIFSGFETIMSLGFDRVLTSGGEPTAFEGIETIAKMEDMACSRAGRHNTVVMPGCGINKDNIVEIMRRTGVCEVHLSASRNYPSGMSVLGGIAASDPTTVSHSDEELISGAVQALRDWR